MTELAYEIRSNKNRGQGVFATREIAVGTIFMSGVLLLSAHTSKDDRNSEVTITKQIYKISHGCSPNAKCDRNKANRMEVSALTDIKRGDEITLSIQDAVLFRAQPRSLSIPDAAVPGVCDTRGPWRQVL